MRGVERVSVVSPMLLRPALIAFTSAAVGVMGLLDCELKARRMRVIPLREVDGVDVVVVSLARVLLPPLRPEPRFAD